MLDIRAQFIRLLISELRQADINVINVERPDTNEVTLTVYIPDNILDLHTVFKIIVGHTAFIIFDVEKIQYDLKIKYADIDRVKKIEAYTIRLFFNPKSLVD